MTSYLTASLADYPRNVRMYMANYRALGCLKRNSAIYPRELFTQGLWNMNYILNKKAVATLDIHYLDEKKLHTNCFLKKPSKKLK